MLFYGCSCDRVSCINGKSRAELPSTYEAICPPLNPMECEKMLCQTACPKTSLLYTRMRSGKGGQSSLPSQRMPPRLRRRGQRWDKQGQRASTRHTTRGRLDYAMPKPPSIQPMGGILRRMMQYIAVALRLLCEPLYLSLASRIARSWDTYRPIIPVCMTTKHSVTAMNADKEVEN